MSEHDKHKYDYLHMEDMEVWSYRENCYCSACSNVRQERQKGDVSLEMYLEQRSFPRMINMHHDGLKEIKES